MKLYCTHDDCRAHAIQELLHAARALPYRRAELAAAARRALELFVPCRRTPRISRTGSPTPPFAPERAP